MHTFYVAGFHCIQKAGTSCAMPAAHAGDSECDCGQKNLTHKIYDSYAGT